LRLVKNLLQAVDQNLETAYPILQNHQAVQSLQQIQAVFQKLQAVRYQIIAAWHPVNPTEMTDVNFPTYPAQLAQIQTLQAEINAGFDQAYEAPLLLANWAGQ